MKAHIRTLFVLLVPALLVSACGKDADSTEAFAFAGYNYRVIRGNTTLTKTDAEISGTGDIVFDMFNGEKQKNYLVNFSLEEGGSLQLIVRAKTDLLDGLVYEFARTGPNAGDFTFKSVGVDKTAFMTPPVVDIRNAVDFSVDVHVHGGATNDLFFFVPSGTLNSPFLGAPHLGIAISENQKRWGLKLKKAKINKVAVRAPNRPH